MFGRQAFQLGNQFGVPAQREVCLYALFEGGQPQLLEVRDGRLRERLVGEVVERWATPQPEGLT